MGEVKQSVVEAGGNKIENFQVPNEWGKYKSKAHNRKYILEGRKKKEGDIPHNLWLSDFPIAHFSI